MSIMITHLAKYDTPMNGVHYVYTVGENLYHNAWYLYVKTVDKNLYPYDILSIMLTLVGKI